MPICGCLFCTAIPNLFFIIVTIVDKNITVACFSRISCPIKINPFNQSQKRVKTFVLKNRTDTNAFPEKHIILWVFRKLLFFDKIFQEFTPGFFISAVDLFQQRKIMLFGFFGLIIIIPFFEHRNCFGKRQTFFFGNHL